VSQARRVLRDTLYGAAAIAMRFVDGLSALQSFRWLMEEGHACGSRGTVMGREQVQLAA
jgi:hypothetical protein